MADDQDGYFLIFQEMQGGIVNNPKIAIDIAELVVANVYGDNEVKLQRPFEAFDETDRWRIEGSYNRDRKIEGHGPIEIWIRKRDAKIIDVVNPVIMEVPEEVQEIIREEMSKKK
ncbi:MAG: YbbC/YhhH family protein [Rhodospirillales bacterium]|nr:YbbC/YhhH family protein [Rhodospirillales bacterium]MDH3790750.1 YbbC/YhhH family protein [Rhodospirillales bacterium]MDH3913546.1 YbbC/YhhH family protein [Rhodospirillales bacterium]MDH3916622.1 YbbC/YhhH family protein [Rhodospirillales bacterium]MDH3965680.1 YbbC/YhhH family protein [Rhodospirillales bacterium]